MEIIAIGNNDNRVTYEGKYNSVDQAIKEISPKYGEFETNITIKDNNGNINYNYISNDKITICLINTDYIDADIIFLRVSEENQNNE